MATSEGAMDLTGKVNAILDRRSYLVGSYLGFSYRDQGRSNLFLYGIPAEYRFQKFFLGASLEGYVSVGYDKDSTDDVVRNSYFERVMGGSRLYGAINPNLLNGSAWGGFYPLRNWKATVGVSNSITGANSAHFLSGFLVVNYAYSSGQKNQRDQFDDEEQVRFRETTDDGIDQKLFQKKEKPVKDKNVKDLKKDLNNTEMQIEMRTKKRTKDDPQ